MLLISIGSRVYINNLKWDTTTEELSAHMAQGGNLISVKLYHYKDGRPKGCGIVEYSTSEEAAFAISSLNDQELKGRKIQVREVSIENYPKRINKSLPSTYF
jgi:RNA recognition motif-containing protein